MTINDAVTNYNLIKEILLQRGVKEMPKSLKVKIMKARLDYYKIKKRFDEELKGYTECIIPDELKTLVKNENRTEAEEFRYKELSEQLNLNYKNFLADKEKEEIYETVTEKFLTLEEYEDVIDINSVISVEINGKLLKPTDFLEIIYERFVDGEI